jgi:PAS domain S-box-containing protein
MNALSDVSAGSQPAKGASLFPTSAAVAMSFFRDCSGHQELKQLARRRLETLSPGKSLRAWVPHCATGQDAYSVAIGLIEAMGNRWREIPLSVFSTDINDDALAVARAGRYPQEAGVGMPRDTLERFFTQDAGQILVRPFLRDACRFASHHLATKPPFAELDLIACRETLATVPLLVRQNTLKSLHSVLASNGVLLDETGAAGEAPELFASAGRGKHYVARRAPTRPISSEAWGGGIVPLVDARLMESEEKFRLLFSQTEDAILVKDANTGHILEANKAAQRLFGASLPELLALRVRDLLVAPETVRRPEAERRAEERLRLPHCRRMDGSIFPADASTAFLMLQGRPCYLWTLRDASPRLRGSAGRERAKKQEEFVGEIVHELRTPITVIRGSVETLRGGIRGTRARGEFLQFIESQAQRMGQLVDRLLDLGAAGLSQRAADPSAVLLAAAAWDIAAAFIPVAKRRGIAIKIDIPPTLAVMADPVDLPHILGNLLDNAIKFTPRRGKVFITGRVQDGEGILSVRDTGGGIAPADLNRVFERFFRSERTRRTKGTGLGLAIVSGIVKANQGRIHADNDPSGGAVFHVALPLARAAS